MCERSMGEEALEDAMIEEMLWQDAVEMLGYNPDTHWKTREGIVVAHRDMTTEHLRNTIRMIRRQYDEDPWFFHGYPEMVEELNRRVRR